jgi:mono/diheme cytochrome c family protein
MSISNLICVRRLSSVTPLAAGMAAVLVFCTPFLGAQNAGSDAVHEPAQFGQTCAVCHGGDAGNFEAQASRPLPT